MKITGVKSHVLTYELDEQLGYSQRYFTSRTAHLVQVETDQGITGLGECFGPGAIAFANKHIVEQVIAPLILGEDPYDREVLWHRVYNFLRDHGQKGMPIQALSGVDIALWDIVGQREQQPLYKIIGGAFRDQIEVYGYGLMLREEPDLTQRFADEAAKIVDSGFRSLKMKIGRCPREDIALVSSVRNSIDDSIRLMVDANHAYTSREAIPLGRELQRLGVFWFEEPVAPEDRKGYRDVRNALDMSIAGGEAEFTRWGFRDLIEDRCVDVLQPEVCGLGGITEYLKVRSLAHAHFVPVVNHVWGSAVSVVLNMHLLAAMPDLPGAAHPTQPMLEFDTTPNRFVEELLLTPIDVAGQVKANGGYVGLPQGPGLGVRLDPDFIQRYSAPG